VAKRYRTSISIAQAYGAIPAVDRHRRRDVPLSDFFKVGISEAGNHDQREYEDDWGERYQGLLVRMRMAPRIMTPGEPEHRKNLKGHLLLAHGNNG